MSEEITPATAVCIGHEFLDAGGRWRTESDVPFFERERQLVDALVSRVEELETGRPRKSSDGGKTWQPQTDAEIEENGRFIAQLKWEQQRDAAVDTLQSIKAVIAAGQDGLMDEGMACIDAAKLADVALAALGAEETT